MLKCDPLKTISKYNPLIGLGSLLVVVFYASVSSDTTSEHLTTIEQFLFYLSFTLMLIFTLVISYNITNRIVGTKSKSIPRIKKYLIYYSILFIAIISWFVVAIIIAWITNSMGW